MSNAVRKMADDERPIELEIQCAGMERVGQNEYTLAECVGDVEFWDVELRATTPETGEIEVLLELDNLSEEGAAGAIAALEAMFPQAGAAETLPCR